MPTKPEPLSALRSTKHLNLVRLGTPSAAQMSADAKLKFESEQRRKKLDDMRQTVRENPVEARLYEHGLGGNAVVVVEARRRDGSVWDYLICDISEQFDDEGRLDELLLIIFCPVCRIQEGREEPALKIHQKNRPWSLDRRNAGKVWHNPQDPREVYVNAGEVTTHEHFQCGVCGSWFNIEKNVLKRELR